jgi:hypothetical protein
MRWCGLKRAATADEVGLYGVWLLQNFAMKKQLSGVKFREQG